MTVKLCPKDFFGKFAIEEREEIANSLITSAIEIIIVVVVSR